MKGRNPKMFLTILLAVILAFGAVATQAIPASAAVTFGKDSKPSSSKKTSEKYFSDVKKGTSNRAEINWLAQRGAFKGIAKKGKKFYPNKIATRKQFGVVLSNLYGDDIDINITSPSNRLTQKYVTDTLTTVSGQLGYKVTWKGGSPKARVSRGDMSRYIRLMIKTAEGGALDPTNTNTKS